MLIIDTNPFDRSILWGTPEDDRIFGRGNAGSINGGKGDDYIDGGTPREGSTVYVNGGAGDDTMIVRADTTLTGGAGANTFILDRPIARDDMATIFLDPERDAFIFDHTDTASASNDGFGVLDVDVIAVETIGTQRWATVGAVTIRAFGEDGEAWVRLDFTDDGRGVHNPLRVQFSGPDPYEEIDRFFHDQVQGDHAPADTFLF